MLSEMKVYSLNEARLMHSLGIRMRCINATRLPSFINQERIFMMYHKEIECEDTNGIKHYNGLILPDAYTEWVIADDI